ncbi:hypothetical protein [Aporhodopirellula aestuarii]|uniref:Lipoprotein n=1 Tax=Aporhodopirellula aestuarii TaxID=2950107 RepID=A0ABT0U4V4_9BACT|nr:hypothetical protein [Aporhodopirellula aestuarii]MCM2371880.1 hypothetical protein [Aporhodopirellula aestuarii]
MPTILRLIAPTTAMVLIFTGCGPSGRDLSDRQWLDMQRELQAERAEVGRQRDLLESDRREFEGRERNDPMLAASISSAALLLCCCLPMVLVAVLLWPRRSHTSDQDVHDLWIDEVVIPLVEETSQTRRLAQTTATQRLATRE